MRCSGYDAVLPTQHALQTLCGVSNCSSQMLAHKQEVSRTAAAAHKADHTVMQPRRRSSNRRAPSPSPPPVAAQRSRVLHDGTARSTFAPYLPSSLLLERPILQWPIDIFRTLIAGIELLYILRVWYQAPYISLPGTALIDHSRINVFYQPWNAQPLFSSSMSREWFHGVMLLASVRYLSSRVPCNHFQAGCVVF